MSGNHNNAFINLNGVPYLLSEYVDQNTFQTIDRALVKSEINIDSTDTNRVIVDISIDDIGHKSDGSLNVLGNATKQNSLIDMIKDNMYRIEHHLPVLKRGLVLRVHYQLENNRTGKVLRSLQEDIKIEDRNYFIDINPDNINDNAIIVNFTNSLVSTINQFTHGTDLMQLRINSIQLGYDCVRPNIARPQIGHSIHNMPAEMYANDGLHNEQEMYYYHKSLQSQQYLGDQHQQPESIIPTQWYDFNRFYHFETSGTEIILHNQEIDDCKNHIMNILCGHIAVNRIFLVQPGQRIIFKFSVWKNDLCIFNDTTRVAEALRVNTTPYWPPQPTPQPVPPVPPSPQPVPYPQPDPFELKHITELLESMKGMDYKQNGVINKLDESLKEITKIIKEYHEGAEIPEVPDSDLPENPDYPPIPPAPGPKPPKPDKGILIILALIKDLQDKVNKIIKDEDNDQPITDEQIQKILDALEADYDDNGKYDGSTDYPFLNGSNEELVAACLGSDEK